MKICFYSVKEYERDYLLEENVGHQIKLLSNKLDNQSVYEAESYDAISIFSRDHCTKEILEILHTLGIGLVCLRSTGFDNIDVIAAKQYGIRAARVQSYSPEAIAEHAIMLILALFRYLYKGQAQIKKYNFSLRGMVGFNIHGKTVGVIGTGYIGQALIKILNGFGANVVAYDINPDYTLYDNLSFEYIDLISLLKQSDIVSLHIPYNEATYHFLDKAEMDIMKPDAIIINTGRGQLINTETALEYLNTSQIGGLGLDVYENEKLYFFEDHSVEGINDTCLIQLLNHDKVVLTGHQAYLTTTAISNIAKITFENIETFSKGGDSDNFIC